MTETPHTLPDGMGRKTPRRVPRPGTDPMATTPGPRPIPGRNIMGDPELLSEVLGSMRRVRRHTRANNGGASACPTSEPDTNRLEHM